MNMHHSHTVKKSAYSNKAMRRLLLLLLLCFMIMPAWSARVKDVARIDGLSDVQLVGYGLVVGLAGTGDGSRSLFTVQSIVNMLKKMGIEVPNDRLRVRNVAAVMVTTSQKPFQKNGTRMDVTLSSIGDARSIEGGTLLMTPLQAANGEVYAVAQGPISVGGIQATGTRTGSRYTKNHVLAGSIPQGAIIHKEIDVVSLNKGELRWTLTEPDFSSAVAMAQAINAQFPGAASAEDAATVAVNLPPQFAQNPMPFIAQTESIEFTVSKNARVVLNERTGTIVAGSEVRIDEIAVSHGSITINVNQQENVEQPNPMTMGTTASTIQEQIEVEEQIEHEMRVIPTVTNAGELAQALNALGVSPRDIISIFQAIKKAGALQAELIIM